MKFAFGLALFSLLLLCTPARAEALRAENLEVGTNLVCDTQPQIERFVALYKGDNAQVAVSAVNAEENDPHACGVVADGAFLRGKEIGIARSKNGTFRIFRILVVGVVRAAGVELGLPTAYFTFERIDEREAALPASRVGRG